MYVYIYICIYIYIIYICIYIYNIYIYIFINVCIYKDLNEGASRKSEGQDLWGPKAFASWVPWIQSRHAFVAVARPTTRESFGDECSTDLHCWQGCRWHWKCHLLCRHGGQTSVAQTTCQGININTGQQKLWSTAHQLIQLLAVIFQIVFSE